MIFHALGIEITRTAFTFVIFKVRCLLTRRINLGTHSSSSHGGKTKLGPKKDKRWNFRRKETTQRGDIR